MINFAKLMDATYGNDHLDEAVSSGLPAEAPRLPWTQDEGAALMLARKILPPGYYTITLDNGGVLFAEAEDLTVISNNREYLAVQKSSEFALRIVQEAMKICLAVQESKARFDEIVAGVG